ncbi:unnamed protein product [Ambrosiozyma monospora]|uniref:Unnamed protein product n=1 Tax=Ambrosiozyma monospora TaxID=43982 RepID=A0ACB5SQR1_AMBMO|nr:unnamed protein product [Ambrosiozyma monospora]
MIFATTKLHIKHDIISLLLVLFIVQSTSCFPVADTEPPFEENYAVDLVKRKMTGSQIALVTVFSVLGFLFVLWIVFIFMLCIFDYNTEPGSDNYYSGGGGAGGYSGGDGGCGGGDGGD